MPPAERSPTERSAGGATPEGLLERLRREVTPELYREIRALWKKHSIAEDQRDIPGLLSTLTDDCVYEIVQEGDRREDAVWRGHAGAERFYTDLLTAFPDIDFRLTEIVIGPQGVWEEAMATGTHREAWLGRPGTGERVSFRVAILFPWDPDRRLFRGEKIYVAGDAFAAGTVGVRT